MEEHTNLVNQGTYLMLDRVLKDLQVRQDLLCSFDPVCYASIIALAASKPSSSIAVMCQKEKHILRRFVL